MVNVHDYSHHGYRRTVMWTVLLALLVMAVVALVARGKQNLNAALINKPDLAAALVLEDKGYEITNVSLLRELTYERDYVVDTNSGAVFVKLIQRDGTWNLAEWEEMRE